MTTRSTFLRVQHVSIARAKDGAAAARRFYGEILGLEEVSPPSSLAHMNLIWYRLGETELHIVPLETIPPDLGQHFCFQVDDVEALRAQLEAAGVAIEDDTVTPNRPRFFCHDPFGNRLECTSILGAYPTA